MTDATYANLDTLVGELKRAAIDAYMVGQGWDLQSDKYHMSSSSTSYDVTRPSSDGSGGGDWDWNGFWDIGNDGQDAKWRANFDTIRDRIDQAIEPWRSLADPDKLAELVESMRLINGRLSVGGVGADGTVTGGGTIAGNLNLAMENSDAMAGGMITAFKSNFMSQLGRAIGGHHAITVILGGFLAAEERIWRGAEESVAAIVAGARDSCIAVAQGGGADWDVVLKVAGYAVSGATIFASGGAKAAVEVAGLGLEILDQSTPSPASPTESPSDDYDSILSAYEKALTQLNTEIADEEESLEANLVTNREQIEAQKGSYDLSRPPVIDIDDDSDLGEIRVDRILALEITGTYLPNIAEELLGAKDDAWDVSNLWALLRDESLGHGGQWGPSSRFHDVRWLLQELLGNLGVETKYAAKSLDLGIKDMVETDSGATDALEEHAAEVKTLGIGTGSLYDPWN